MLGTRISAPVSAHLRDIQGGTGVAGGRWSKVLALAPRVIYDQFNPMDVPLTSLSGYVEH